MAQLQSQMDQRRPAKYKDQHGRLWTADVEKSTGMPCQPLSGEFSAPIKPPKKYVTVDPDIPGRVNINYGLWINELREADKVWWRDAQIVGAAEHKEHFNPSAPLSQTVLNKMGERPRVPKTRTPLRAPVGDAALPVIAAMQGNAWVLGLTGPQGQKPKMPEKLREFFERPIDALPSFTDEFEDVEEPVVEKPRNKGGRPTNAERAAKLAAVPAGVASEEDWAK